MAQGYYRNSPAEIAELYNLCESKYPVNDEFINGCIYPLPNNKILGDPYFKSVDWQSGSLYINGRHYPNIMLKYDLIIDELIIKTRVQENIERLISLNKSQIDSFYIGTSLFVNSQNIFQNENVNTYYEKVFSGSLEVYKHYQKTFIDMFSNSSPDGKFSSQKSNTYLFDYNKLTNINSTKSFLACFEKTDQDRIKKFLKSNNINYKKISDLQISALLEFCTTTISK